MRCAVCAKLMTLFCCDTAELYIPWVPVASSTCTDHDRTPEETTGNVVLVTRMAYPVARHYISVLCVCRETAMWHQTKS
jgi:hypothetical protein